jgi:hypothetical protein
MSRELDSLAREAERRCCFIERCRHRHAFSNHATLISIPRAFAVNLLPHGFDAIAFAALVERVSARAAAWRCTRAG